MNKRMIGVIGLGSILVAASGCSGASKDDGSDLHATIGAEGGELVGAQGSALEGVHVVIPPGALASATDVHVHLATSATALPATAKACGKTFAIEPAGLTLAQPATVTLPFDEDTVTAAERFDDEVKVWVQAGDAWGQQRQIDSAAGSVTVELGSFTEVAPGVNPPKDVDVVRFKLLPNPKFQKCIAQYPDDPSRPPSADVVVVRGDQRDSLRLLARNVKPGLDFDMFTVEHTSLQADGTPDPAFTNFGMAWYQSDVETGSDGVAHADIRTILLDEIFGFDPAANLPPTGTFHVGIWFHDPNDAAPCGFDTSKPTPFNGEHDAGPVAMISAPTASTLGPLCTKPDTSVTPARCSP